MPSFQKIQFKYIHTNLFKTLIRRFPVILVPRMQHEILEYKAFSSTKTKLWIYTLKSLRFFKYFGHILKVYIKNYKYNQIYALGQF